MHRDIDLPALLRAAGVEHAFADQAAHYVEVVHESVRFEFQRVGDRVPILDATAFMLRGVHETAGLEHELCLLTADYDSGYRFRLNDHSDVCMTAVRRLDDMTLADIKRFVDDLIDEGDMLDDFLQEQFGGETALE